MANKKKEITTLLEHKGFRISFDEHCYSVGKLKKGKNGITMTSVSYATSVQYSLSLHKSRVH